MNSKTIIEEIQIPYTDEVMNIKEKEPWMMLNIHFLKRGNLPSDKKEARKIECHLTYFFIEN